MEDDKVRLASEARSFYIDAIKTIVDRSPVEFQRLVNNHLQNVSSSPQEIFQEYHAEGKNLLHIACSSAQINIVEEIVSRCEDVKTIINTPDHAGFTPLMNAMIAESSDI